MHRLVVLIVSLNPQSASNSRLEVTCGKEERLRLEEEERLREEKERRLQKEGGFRQKEIKRHDPTFIWVCDVYVLPVEGPDCVTNWTKSAMIAIPIRASIRASGIFKLSIGGNRELESLPS